jgi:hypothetical protein
LIELRTINPLAKSFLEIDPEGVNEIQELINSLCSTTTSFDVFKDDVLQLVVSGGNAQLALEWVNQFWKLMIREIKPILNSHNYDVIKKAVETVNSSNAVINGLMERYQLGVNTILPHKEVLQSFAEILQGVEIEGSGSALIVVMTWLTKIE